MLQIGTSDPSMMPPASATNGCTSRVCQLVASGAPRTAPLSHDARAWRTALQELLEARAAALEGPGDQELVIRGGGEDGDILVDMIWPDLPGAWECAGPGGAAAQALVALEIEGPDGVTQAAAFALLEAFSAAVRLSGLKLTWKARSRAAAEPVPVEDFAAGICLPDEEHNEFFFGPLKASAGA